MKGLTEADRAMIDAAIRAGRVQVIPRGESGLPVPQWNGHSLVYADGRDRAKRANNAVWGVQGKEYVPPAVLARRKHVAALQADGLTVPQIAAALCISEDAVRRDHQSMNLPVNRIVRRGVCLAPRGVSAERQARLDKIVPLRCGGMKMRDIAARLGVPITTIESDIRQLRMLGRVPDQADWQEVKRRNAA